jgi:hypothetical protein
MALCEWLAGDEAAPPASEQGEIVAFRQSIGWIAAQPANRAREIRALVGRH